jgi:hypothetical protein
MSFRKRTYVACQQPGRYLGSARGRHVGGECCDQCVQLQAAVALEYGGLQVITSVTKQLWSASRVWIRLGYGIIAGQWE